MDTHLLTTEEIATCLHCRQRYVYGLIAAGKLPAVKAGKRYLVHEKTFEQWIRDSCVRRSDDDHGRQDKK